MIGGSQILALHLGFFGLVLHFLISAPSDQPFSVSIPLSLQPLWWLSSGIPSIIPHKPQTSLCVCASPRQRLRTLSPAFPSDVIIWWLLAYSWARQILFLVSLNTPNKRRAPSVVALLPFTLVSLRTLRDYTHTWFEFEPCPPHANIRHALNLSHILMDGGAGGRFAGSWAIPLTLTLFIKIFIWLDSRNEVKCPTSEWGAEIERGDSPTMKWCIRLLRLRPPQLSNSCLSDDKSHLGLIPNNETFLFLVKPFGPVLYCISPHLNSLENLYFLFYRPINRLMIFNCAEVHVKVQPFI